MDNSVTKCHNGTSITSDSSTTDFKIQYENHERGGHFNALHFQSRVLKQIF
jgi:hypothetical protein